MQVLGIINVVIGVIFTLFYFYQFVFLIVAYVGKRENIPDADPRKYAVLIAARNESAVIHNPLNSLNAQDYPKDRFTVFLVADNCTDNTAEIARKYGATVYERFNQVEKGKGYAIDYLIKCIERDYGDDYCDAYIVFDADNVAEKNYITEMNKTYALGYDVVTSYRNASNYGANWRSAGQGMFFLRESRVLNLARMRTRGNNYVTGTGFLFSRKLCRENGGWPFHCLTEDGEFTMDNVVKGVKTGYCNTAMFYDEQVTDPKVSWNQRLRWCKGGLQIYKKYCVQLFKGLFSKKFLSFFDMTMCLNAAYFISLTAVIVNVVADVVILAMGCDDILGLIITQAWMAVAAYFMLFIFSAVITCSEWRFIRGGAFKKVLYAFTFPLFIFSFIPIAFVAIFKKVEWKQIAHNGDDGKVAQGETAEEKEPAIK